MEESKVTSKGQTTIPKKIRDAMSIKPGDTLRYVIDGEVLLVLPVRPISRLHGSLKYDGPPKTLEDMDRAIAEKVTERAMRR